MPSLCANPPELHRLAGTGIARRLRFRTDLDEQARIRAGISGALATATGVIEAITPATSPTGLTKAAMAGYPGRLVMRHFPGTLYRSQSVESLLPLSGRSNPWGRKYRGTGGATSAK